MSSDAPSYEKKCNLNNSEVKNVFVVIFSHSSVLPTLGAMPDIAPHIALTPVPAWLRHLSEEKTTYFVHAKTEIDGSALLIHL